MKLKILALTALLTICTVAPVEAGSVVDFRISDDRGPGIIIVPSGRRNQVYDPRYRYDWNRHPRYQRRYRDNRYYHPRYWNYRPRYRSDWYYHPRRSYIQFGIGF